MHLTLNTFLCKIYSIVLKQTKSELFIGEVCHLLVFVGTTMKGNLQVDCVPHYK